MNTFNIRNLFLIICLLIGTGFSQKIKVVILTGGHDFDRPRFFGMFDGMDTVDWTEQQQAIGGEIFTDISQWDYDVIIFYNHQGPGSNFTDLQKQNLLTLVDRGIGIIVLHHAVAAYPHWPEFEKIAGVKFYSSRYYSGGNGVTISGTANNVDMEITLSDTSHDMASGFPDKFTLNDETYNKMVFGTGNDVFLTTDNPLSDEPLAWTRTYANSRVFTTPLGHGGNIFDSTLFAHLLQSGIEYVSTCDPNLQQLNCRPLAVIKNNEPRNLFINKDLFITGLYLGEHISLMIYNMQGREIFKSDDLTNGSKIKQKFSRGIYNATLSRSNGVQNFRFMVNE